MSDKGSHPHQVLAELAAAGAALPGLLWDFKAFWMEPAGSGRRSRVYEAVARTLPARSSDGFLDQNLRLRLSAAMKKESVIGRGGAEEGGLDLWSPPLFKQRVPAALVHQPDGGRGGKRGRAGRRAGGRLPRPGPSVPTPARPPPRTMRGPRRPARRRPARP